MKISLEKAFDILENCSAVIIDSVVTYPRLSDLDGDTQSVFMCLHWEAEGLEYAVNFNEGQNKEVKVYGSFMFLIDEAGDEKQLTVLEHKNLEI